MNQIAFREASNSASARGDTATTVLVVIVCCRRLLHIFLHCARGVPELFLLLRRETVEDLLQRGLAEGVLPDAQGFAFPLLKCCWRVVRVWGRKSTSMFAGKCWVRGRKSTTNARGHAPNEALYSTNKRIDLQQCGIKDIRNELSWSRCHSDFVGRVGTVDRGEWDKNIGPLQFDIDGRRGRYLLAESWA